MESILTNFIIKAFNLYELKTETRIYYKRNAVLMGDFETSVPLRGATTLSPWPERTSNYLDFFTFTQEVFRQDIRTHNDIVNKPCYKNVSDVKR